MNAMSISDVVNGPSQHPHYSKSDENLPKILEETHRQQPNESKKTDDDVNMHHHYQRKSKIIQSG